MPSRARRLFLLVASIRQHTQAEAHTRSQTRGVRETEEMSARCSFLIPAPQGSTRQYESFSSLALTRTFSGVVFDGGHYWSALRGVVHWAPPPAGANCCIKRKREKKGKKEDKLLGGPLGMSVFKITETHGGDRLRRHVHRRSPPPFSGCVCAV